MIYNALKRKCEKPGDKCRYGYKPCTKGCCKIKCPYWDKKCFKERCKNRMYERVNGRCVRKCYRRG